MERYAANLLTIKGTGERNRGKVFQAYVQDEISFSVGVFYDTIFHEVINFRNVINQLLAGIATFGEMVGGKSWVGALAERASEYLGTGIFAQGLAWTRKFGGIPEHITFRMSCKLVNFDSTQEIFNKLNTLYDIAVPPIGGSHVARIPQMSVMVEVGGWLLFEECFITDISHEFSKMSVENVPLWVDLSIDFTTRYAVDRNLLGVQGKKIHVYTLR